ncbi:MAG: RNA methyltransferase [Deltaproteobacteria bacterium]|nr:RNA methyltransferase [Deltaproteobacteria bacterium]
MRRKTKDKKQKEGSSASNNISIVLVEPQSPGNVGSVARAMKNTGFSDLVLINPCDHSADAALSMACNAFDILKGARVFKTLDDYAAEPGVIVATTRRMGRTRYPILTIQEATEKILELSAGNNVAVLFGREDRGLHNDEVKLADILVEIPTHEDYPSLNLSSAVLIFCWQVFTAGNPKAEAVKVAPRAELEKMYVHMEKTLRALEYGDGGAEHILESILRSFRRLFGRTGLMQKEINMLRGILTQVDARVSPLKRKARGG